MTGRWARHCAGLPPFFVKTTLPEETERTAIVAETRYRGQQLGVNEIDQLLCTSKATLYKYLRHRGFVIHTH